MVRWRSTERLRTALSGLFLVVAAANAALGFALTHRIDVINQISRHTVTVPEARLADRLVGWATLASLVFLVPAGILFIVWQWRSAKNAEALGRTGAQYGAGWSIGGWFIPLANLVIPVIILQDLWRSSDPESSPDSWRTRPRSSLIRWWWGTIVVGWLAGRFGANTTAGTASVSQLRSANETASAGAVLFVAASILAIFVVRRITDRQVDLRMSFASVGEAGARSGWYPDPSGRFEHRYWDGNSWTEHLSETTQSPIDPLMPPGGPPHDATRD
jgi:Domain of unknown function (DUF4328)/Protein of unknown function (DUF2510)